MSWIRALAYAAVATCLVAGCKNQSTGVHITVRSKGALYDELRFFVSDVANPTKPVTLVDPGTAGRKTGLASEPNPDVVVLLDDGLDGHEIFCDVAALRDGQPAGSGNAHVTALAHQIRDVEVFLIGAPGVDAGAPADAAVDANHGGSGGRGGGSGGRGGGSGEGGGNGAGGSDGAGGAGSTGTGGSNGNGGSNGSGGNTGVGGMAGSNGSGGNPGVGGSGTGGASGSGGNTGAGGKAGTGALGSACTDGGQCASSFCADSVCCENACTGACTTCNFNKGTAGTCRPINHAVDPHHVCVNTGAGNCGTDGTCDNAGMCTNKFNTTCTPGCASDTSLFAAGVCGQTACVGFGSVPCPANMSSCVAGICQ